MIDLALDGQSNKKVGDVPFNIIHAELIASKT